MHRSDLRTFIHFLPLCGGEEVAEPVEHKDIPVLTLLQMCVKEWIIDTDQVHQWDNLLHKQQPAGTEVKGIFIKWHFWVMNEIPNIMIH